jgi:hypothetical protein
MEDFPAKIADLLESVATKVRRLTVERVAGWARWTAVGFILALLGALMLIFFLVAIFRLLAGLVTVEGAYGIFGGIFVLIGIFLWSKRLATPEQPTLVEREQ